MLSEKNVPWEPILVDLVKREHREPGFLSLSPYGKVPVLTDGAFVMYESTIINEYLEEVFPAPPLTFLDPARRAEVRMWEDYGDSAFLAPAEAIFIHQKGWRIFEEKELDRFRAELHQCLSRVEQRLEGREFLVDRFTLADIAFAPRAVMLEELGIEVGPKMNNVRAWVQRLKSRESIGTLES